MHRITRTLLQTPKKLPPMPPPPTRTWRRPPTPSKQNQPISPPNRERWLKVIFTEDARMGSNFILLESNLYKKE